MEYTHIYNLNKRERLQKSDSIIFNFSSTSLSDFLHQIFLDRKRRRCT